MERAEQNFLRRQWEKIKPNTTGEKMVAGGVGVDVGVMATLSMIRLLQQEDITNFTPEQIQVAKDVLFFGFHILASDVVLKIGGVGKMVFFEEGNWLKKRVDSE